MLHCVNCGCEVSEHEGTRRDCARFDMHLDNNGDRRNDGVLCRACYTAGGICWHCELDAPTIGPTLEYPTLRAPEDDAADWGKAEYRPDVGEEDSEYA